MKKFIFLFWAMALSTLVMAQVPFQFNFQTVARNAQGNPLTEQAVSFRLSVLQYSISGDPVFIETQSTQTNTFGLANLLVGSGTSVLGTLDAVDWEDGPYFLQVEIDLLNGIVFEFAGVSPLLSVPYALHAKTTEQPGPEGPAGMSAYDVWLAEGNAGSEADFLNALVGPQGPAGDPGSGGGGNTLGEAYNQGGAGEGRTIISDAGAVEINLTGGGTTGLEVNSSVALSSSFRASNSATGVAIRAENTNPSNTFSAMQAITNSSNSESSAILGNNDGAGYGVAGQIPSNASGGAAVYGSNLRLNGGSGVEGIGYNGVVGTAQNGNGFGLYGLSNGSSTGSTLSIGTYGLGFNGVYGQTSNVNLGWAGYFTADIGVEGTGYSTGGWLNVSDRRLKSDITPIEGALERVLSLNGYRYTLTTPRSPILKSNGEREAVKDHTEVQYGVIAQEVETLFPEMVSTKQIFINSGDDTEYKVVNYDALIPVLIEAIRELNEKVEALTRERE